MQPINPNATKQARNLLRYLAGQYGHRILGNFLAIARGANAPARAA